MERAINELAARILTFQGNGDYAGVGEWMTQGAAVRQTLNEDFARLQRLGIPVDIVFDQGTTALGM